MFIRYKAAVLFVIIALGGWFLIIGLMYGHFVSDLAILAFIAYFLGWLTLMVHFATCILIGNSYSVWQVLLYMPIGMILGFFAGLFSCGYFGMFLGGVMGPIIGLILYLFRMLQYAKGS